MTLLSVALVAPFATSVSASDARNYQAGRIIDDGIFTNSNSMTVANIQSFFNSKVTCDTYGQQQSELGGGTRAQWLAAHGYSVPVTCLRDYYENPANGANNYGKAIPTGAISAAQIVYNYSQMFSINPQVIITTLQKEQGLVTDEWPTPRQYSQALGFGCPDNVAPGAPACDPSYGSFSTQVYQAARHFRGFMNNTPGWFIPFTTGVNSVRWSPNASCGSGSVNILNRSTVALYSYTPYQPNQAALNAQYGTGDACSAYGNRNFYLYFTDWFGPTFGGDPVSTNVRLTSPITISPAQPVAGQTITVSYTVKNFGSTAINFDASVLQCRFNTTGSCDSAYGNTSSIAAGASITISNTTKLPVGGSYSLVPFFMSGGVWSRYGAEPSIQNNLSLIVPEMAFTSGISTSPSQPVVGQPLTVTYTIRNFSSQPAIIQDSVLQCRDQAMNSCDSAYSGPFTLQPGEYRSYSQTITPTTDGQYTLIPYFLMNGSWYTYNATQPGITIDVPDLRLTGDISVSPSTPVPGQDMTITYSVKNFGSGPVNYSGSILQCRVDTWGVCDPTIGAADSIAAGATKSFSIVIPASKAGTYRLIPYYMVNGKWFMVNQGIASSSIKDVVVPRYVADMRIVGDITYTPSNPIPGESVSVTYTVKNFGTLPAIYQTSVLQCRFNITTNCDSDYTGPLTINPGTTHDFNYTITNFARTGIYAATPYFMQNGDWHLYGYDAGGSSTKSVVVPNYSPDLQLTGDITISPTTPTVGQTVTATYTLKNFGSKTINYTASVLQCRINLTASCDRDWDTGTSLAPGAAKTFTTILPSLPGGSYRLLPYYLYNGQWFTFGQGAASSNTKTFVVN